jgi:hypothetical protein
VWGSMAASAAPPAATAPAHVAVASLARRPGQLRIARRTPNAARCRRPLMVMTCAEAARKVTHLADATLTCRGAAVETRPVG